VAVKPARSAKILQNKWNNICHSVKSATSVTLSRVSHCHRC